MYGVYPIDMYTYVCIWHTYILDICDIYICTSIPYIHITNDFKDDGIEIVGAHDYIISCLSHKW